MKEMLLEYIKNAADRNHDGELTYADLLILITELSAIILTKMQKEKTDEQK